MAYVIWWIRRDLRLQENIALAHAISSGQPIIPLFIFDPQLSTKSSNRKKDFIFSALHALNEELIKFGSRLHVFEGDPLFVFKNLAMTNPFISIFAEKDYSPYAKRRDQQISCEFNTDFVDGLTVHPVSSVLKPDDTPYTIFTPFSRAWLNKPLPDIPLYKLSSVNFDSSHIPGESTLPAVISSSEISESVTKEALQNFLNEKIFSYSEARNLMGIEGTSKLSSYFHFGLLSSRYAALKTFLVIENTKSSWERDSAQQWLNELIWRDFYYGIMDAFPFVLSQPFRPKMTQFPWIENTKHINAWQQGLTGYPIIDAAMRELLETGWMHNRARMITASFLTKDLLINWQYGEKWFMQNLIDGDAACNNGGWQWSAGSGTDAAPFFRIFNPILQAKKYDPGGDYVRKWVPEVARLPNIYLHEPWTLPYDLQTKYNFAPGKQYPLPIIDHQFARERALTAFRNLSD